MLSESCFSSQVVKIRFVQCFCTWSFCAFLNWYAWAWTFSFISLILLRKFTWNKIVSNQCKYQYLSLLAFLDKFLFTNQAVSINIQIFKHLWYLGSHCIFWHTLKNKTYFDFVLYNLNFYLEFQIMQIRYLSAPSFQYFLNCNFIILLDITTAITWAIFIVHFKGPS